MGLSVLGSAQFPPLEAGKPLRETLAGCTIWKAELDKGKPETTTAVKPKPSELCKVEEGGVGGTPEGSVVCEPAISERTEPVSENLLCLARQRKELQGPVDLKGLVTFLCKAGSKSIGLKKKIIELRLNGIRFAQRLKELGYRKGMFEEPEGVPKEPARVKVPVEKKTGKRNREKGSEGKEL